MLPFKFQIHHVQSILGISGKPLFGRCRRESDQKANENREIHGNCTWVKKRNLTANDRQEVKLGSQKPPKDGNESQTHGLSNALPLLVKVESINLT